METLNYLITAIQEQIANAVSTLLGSILLGVALGFIIGLVIVIYGGKKKVFRRSNGFWSFIAGLNYIYIPVLLTVLGGFLGTVGGAHKLSGNFINSSTQPIVEYAQGYLPEIQNFVNTQLGANKGQDIQIEELIAMHLTNDLNLDANSYEYQAVNEINQAIMGTYLTFADVPESISGLRTMDLTNMSPDVFYVLPDTLHEVCDGFFFFKYIGVLVMFLPFIMISVLEYFIHRFFGTVKPVVVPPLRRNRNVNIPPLPRFESDFV